MDLAAIKQLAEDLNYEGQDLRYFVDKQIQLYEDELNKSSEKDEREERMKRRELDLRERELQAREKEREHEIKLKELELKREGSKNESNGEETKQGKVKSFTRIPELTNFNPEHDDLPAYIYISRFELTASQNRWNEEEKFIGLSNLLTGECLQVLHSLQDKSYNALKDALFKRYKYTEEGFHERFRKTCPKEGEDFSNYVNRLVLGRDRWFESAGVEKDIIKA